MHSSFGEKKFHKVYINHYFSGTPGNICREFFMLSFGVSLKPVPGSKGNGSSSPKAKHHL